MWTPPTHASATAGYLPRTTVPDQEKGGEEWEAPQHHRDDRSLRLLRKATRRHHSQAVTAFRGQDGGSNLTHKARHSGMSPHLLAERWMRDDSAVFTVTREEHCQQRASTARNLQFPDGRYGDPQTHTDDLNEKKKKTLPSTSSHHQNHQDARPTRTPFFLCGWNACLSFRIGDQPLSFSWRSRTTKTLST